MVLLGILCLPTAILAGLLVLFYIVHLYLEGVESGKQFVFMLALIWGLTLVSVAAFFFATRLIPIHWSST